MNAGEQGVAEGAETEKLIQLIQALAKQGGRIVVRDGNLELTCRKEGITPELLHEIKTHKARLIGLLNATQASPATPAIERAVDPNDAPLSHQQERLFFLWRLNPEDVSYNMPLVFRLEGALDLRALEDALGDIFRRHRILGTRFWETERGPRARHETVPVALEIVDIPVEETERELTRRASLPFDLLRDSLVRWCLLREGAEAHVLFVMFHHIIFDGGSTEIFQRELAEFYRSAVSGAAGRLAENGIQYFDYCAWQRANEANDEARLNAWTKTLAPPWPTLELPGDAKREGGGAEAGSVSFVVADSTAVRLRELGRRQGVTLFMLLLAAYKVLIAKLTAESDLLIGVPVNGRDRAETENLIGFFVNTVVIRTRAEPAKSFRDYLQEIRGAVLDAFANQNVPFEKIVERLNPIRAKNQHAIFQQFFNFIQAPPPERNGGMIAGTLKITGHSANFLHSKFDLATYVVDNGVELSVGMAFRKALFARERMEELARQYEEVLLQIVEDPGAAIGQISVETPAFRQLTFREAGETAAAASTSVVEALGSSFSRWPGRLAVTEGAKQWTYAELGEKATAVARALKKNGVEAGEVVGVLAARSAELVWILLGIWKCGAAFTILDRDLPMERLRKQVRIAGCVRLIPTGERAIPPDLLAEGVGAAELRLVAEMAGDPEPHLPTESRGEDLAYVALTSGSTGEPKGVIGTHAPISHFLEWYRKAFPWGDEERFALLSGLSYDPLLRDIFGCLAVGGTLVVPAGTENHSVRMGRWLAEKKISVLHTTPPVLRAWMKETEKTFRLAKLSRVFCGGDRLLIEDCRRLRTFAPQVTIINSYGTTETPQIAACEIFPPGREISQCNHGTVTIGQGIEDVVLTVRKPDGRRAGVGERGEIYVESRFLARGYVEAPGLTAERFVSTETAGRAYRTGDWGRYRVDGRVEFHGRGDRQLKVQGVRLEPAETEREILRLGIREALVTALADESGDSRLVAFVVGGPSQILAEDLRRLLLKVLRREQVPVSFVSLDALPRTETGKIDAARLGVIFRRKQRETDEGNEPPSGPVEKAIEAVWTRLLKRPRFGRRENFFLAGGHSFLAVEMLAIVRRQWGHALSLPALFENPTIEAIARTITEAVEREKSLQPAQTPQLSRLKGVISCEFERLGKEGVDGTPLIVVGAAASDVLVFRNLVQLLVASRPVYVLKAEGLERPARAGFSMEELCAFFAERLRSACPHGEYDLLGWCQGGMVCVEMARHLQAKGCRINFVGGIDTRSPQGEGDIANRDASIADPPSAGHGREKKAEGSRLGRMIRNRWGALFHLGWRMAIRCCQRLHIPLPVSWRDRAILNCFALLLRDYRPKPVSLDLTLFWSEEDPAWAKGRSFRVFDPFAALAGWRRIVQGAVALESVPGDHTSVFHSPNVEVLHQKFLQACARAKNLKA